MLVLGLGGAAISIVNGDLSITISGMSLASIVGILLNLFIKTNDEKPIAVKISDNKHEINKLKKEVKEELTVELKEEIINEIKKEFNKKKGNK